MVVGLDDEGALAIKLVIEVLRRLKNIPPAQSVQLVHGAAKLAPAQRGIPFKNNVVNSKARTLLDVNAQYLSLGKGSVGFGRDFCGGVREALLD